MALVRWSLRCHTGRHVIHSDDSIVAAGILPAKMKDCVRTGKSGRSLRLPGNQPSVDRETNDLVVIPHGSQPLTCRSHQ